MSAIAHVTTAAPDAPLCAPAGTEPRRGTRFKQLKRAGREVLGRVVTIETGTSVRRGRVFVTTENQVGPPQRALIEADVDLGVFDVLIPRGRRAVHAHFLGGDAYEDCDEPMPRGLS